MTLAHQKQRLEVKPDGTHEDLHKITTRLPHDTSARLQGLANAKRQSVSLYLSRLIAKHVKDPDT